MNKIRISLLSVAISAALIGCGGGSQEYSGPSALGKQSVSGHVIGSIIVGATVRLACGDKTYNAVSKTDYNGAFSVEDIPGYVDLQTCTLLSTGGRGSDGNDFTGLTLKAPYKLFGQGDEVLVTPTTTLLARSDYLDLDMLAAKASVATYLGLDVSYLLKNPIKNLTLGVISKQIIKVALKRDSAGNLTDFLDVDDAGDSLDHFVSTLDITEEQREELVDLLAAIGQATDVNDITKQAIIGNVYSKLKRAYRQDAYLYIQRKNLKLLAERITEANKKEGKYRAVTGLHVRKALIDLGITPSFVDGEPTILEVSITDKLNLSAVEFAVFLNAKTINISHIEDLILFHVDSSEKILGDDNDKRRTYYTFSDISNVAKLLGLVSDNYNDRVNDSINAGIALSLVNLGFAEEGLKHSVNTIYGDNIALASLDDLAERFVELGKKEEAKKASLKVFHKTKERVEILGAANATFDVSIWLIDVMHNLNTIGEYELSDEVMKYFLELALEAQETTASIPAFIYSNLNRHIEVLSHKEAMKGNLVRARMYARLAAETSVNISVEPFLGFIDITHMAVNQGYRAAVNAGFFGEHLAARIAADRAASLPETFKQSGIIATTDWYRLKIIHKGLSGDLAGALTDFNNIRAIGGREDIKTIKSVNLQAGFAALLFTNGKEDELFNIYADKSIFSSDRELRSLSRHIVSGRHGGWGLPTPLRIQLLKGDDKLEEYLDRFFALMETWDINSSRDAQMIYAGLSDEGYLGLASLYMSLNRPEKAELVLRSAFDNVNAISSSSSRIQGLINILNKRAELGLISSLEESILLSRLSHAALSDATTDIRFIVKAANSHTTFNENEQAKILLNKAYSLVETEIAGDLDNVQNRVLYLISNGSSLRGNYFSARASIAYGYFKAGDVVKARELVAEALASVNTLEKTAQKFKLLVPIASFYGLINDLDSAKAVIAGIGTEREVENALIQVAQSLSRFDAFSTTDVASVDSDNDGKPDFFNAGITQEQIAKSGLVLDDDIDNDGITDDFDVLPYDKIN